MFTLQNETLNNHASVSIAIKIQIIVGTVQVFLILKKGTTNCPINIYFRINPYGQLRKNIFMNEGAPLIVFAEYLQPQRRSRNQ